MDRAAARSAVGRGAPGVPVLQRHPRQHRRRDHLVVSRVAPARSEPGHGVAWCHRLRPACVEPAGRLRLGWPHEHHHPARPPGPAGHAPASQTPRTTASGRRPDPRAHRLLRADLQQHHLRRLRRGDELLAVLPDGEQGWGIVPVWGFATVVQSLHPGVAVGERLYGYLPMASQRGAARPSVCRPSASATPRRIAPNCLALYNQYLRMQRRPALHAPAPKTCRRCCGRCSSPPG